MGQNKLYTIGSSSRPEQEFIGMLKMNGIQLLIDVRSRRGSRVLHFDESRFGNLSSMLYRHDIKYDSSLSKELGGYQGGKATIGNFRKYTGSPAFIQGLEALKTKVNGQDGNVVILCCERNPKQCHRKVIGDVLENEGWLVFHLV